MKQKRNVMARAEAADRALFISRDLSWLDFDSRVIGEAELAANPLLERLRFVAISAGNLDEFFMVRIAGLLRAARSGRDEPDPAGNTAARQLEKARDKVLRMIRRQSACLLDGILPELERHGVRLRRPAELDAAARRELAGVFLKEILPVLTPLAAECGRALPVLNSGVIVIALSLENRDGKSFRAFVELPDSLPRFLPVASSSGRVFVPLEELVTDNTDVLFPGAKVKECFVFRLTRDMEDEADGGGFDDLARHIGRQLMRRRRNGIVRLEIPRGTRGDLFKWLLGEFEVAPECVYFVRGPLRLAQFVELAAAADAPGLSEAPWPPLPVPELAGAADMFQAVASQGPILIAQPYQSFDALVSLLERAAEDPGVLAIKQTLYRVSGDSPVVRALCRAAENGKQVTVVVELKARFDEGNNIAWARMLDESGARVIYGVADLKIHCKALLIVRREPGGIRRYVHLGTGNYNERTAKFYTDLGVLSCDEELASDVSMLFNMLTGSAAPPEKWNRLVVSPFGMRKKLEALIEREIARVRSGGKGRIVAKMNSFSDERMVRLIHRAADAGVEVDLIVRGICCCRPRPGQRNLRIISIVDRYLEHSRVFCFGDLGNEEFFISSADWMSRNLDRRIETMFPVASPELCGTLREMLRFQLEDADKARKLLASGVYTSPAPAKYSEFRSQRRTYRMFRKLAARSGRAPRGKLKVFRPGKAGPGDGSITE